MKKLLISTALVAATTAASYAQDTTFRLEADPMEIHGGVRGTRLAARQGAD
ncbi:hypothetical protein R5H32_20810 [Defluviimonas sp. D31]|uniref:hypothetical protein n=1 Tax=Defluviimonas sp. D31 TaxID=3083253 RepID=UPI00296F4032|nr:hypothetical protein [Defluviimonas sp. D31]MDW4551765.1 hypothetical protein [Defluviimonas sp. D31]